MQETYAVTLVAASPLASEHFTRYAHVLSEREHRVCLILASQQETVLAQLPELPSVSVRKAQEQDLSTQLPCCQRIVADVASAARIFPQLAQKADKPTRTLYIAENQAWVSDSYNGCIQRMLPLVDELLYASWQRPMKGVRGTEEQAAYHPELRVRSVGYYSNMAAKQLKQLRKEQSVWRSHFFKGLQMQADECKIVVYLGRDQPREEAGSMRSLAKWLEDKRVQRLLTFVYQPASAGREEDLEAFNQSKLFDRQIAFCSPFSDPLHMLAAADAVIYSINELACAAGLCGLPVIHRGACPGDDFWLSGAIHEERNSLAEPLRKLVLNQLEPRCSPAELRRALGKSVGWQESLEHCAVQPAPPLDVSTWIQARRLSEQIEPLKSSLVTSTDLAGYPNSSGGVEFRQLLLPGGLRVSVSMELNRRWHEVKPMQFYMETFAVYRLHAEDGSSAQFWGAEELDAKGQHFLTALLPH